MRIEKEASKKYFVTVVGFFQAYSILMCMTFQRHLFHLFQPKGTVKIL